MNTIKLFTCTAVIFVFMNFRAFGTETTQVAPRVQDNLGNIVASIDKKCRDEIGVSILALGILSEAKPGSFFLVDSLNSSGRMSAVTQLEKRGFLQVLHVKSGHEEMVQLIPTEQGHQLIKFLTP